MVFFGLPMTPCQHALHALLLLPLHPRSFRARGVPLPAHMLKKGHAVSWFSEKENRGLFEGCTDADNDSYVLPFPHPQEAAKRGVQVVGLVVKERGASIMQCLQKYGIPVVLDLIDSTVYKLPSFKVRAGRRLGGAQTGRWRDRECRGRVRGVGRAREVRGGTRTRQWVEGKVGGAGAGVWGWDRDSEVVGGRDNVHQGDVHWGSVTQRLAVTNASLTPCAAAHPAYPALHVRIATQARGPWKHGPLSLLCAGAPPCPCISVSVRSCAQPACLPPCASLPTHAGLQPYPGHQPPERGDHDRQHGRAFRGRLPPAGKLRAPPPGACRLASPSLHPDTWRACYLATAGGALPFHTQQI